MEKQVNQRGCPAEISVDPIQSTSRSKYEFIARVSCPRGCFTYISDPYGSFSEKIAQQTTRRAGELILRAKCPINLTFLQSTHIPT